MEYTLNTHAAATIRERNIRAEWIAATESDPDDPTPIHALRVIPEFGERVLRVIYNQTKQPPHVVTAFFDRGMKGKL
ncbi:MAG: DUF4258 domain-containing protein [Rhodocyclaceae bacterium]|nr:DUF4258 domain-containing protein [Rhodocyclaceae bacterium]